MTDTYTAHIEDKIEEISYLISAVRAQIGRASARMVATDSPVRAAFLMGVIDANKEMLADLRTELAELAEQRHAA